MKRAKGWLRILGLVAGFLLGQDAFADSDGPWEFSYDDSNSTAQIYGYRGGMDENVIIPSTVYRRVEEQGHIYNPRYTVKGFATRTFEGYASIEKVTIPNTITSIEFSAFNACTNLKTVTIPNSVKSIGDTAFWGCYALEGPVPIPDNLIYLGEMAFSVCPRLTSVTVPGSVEVFCPRVFELCTGLKTAIIEGGVPGIGRDAFSWCSGLEKVEIQDGVKHIWERAFSHCSSLESVTIPGSVEDIWEFAFSDCTGLKTVTIGDGTKSIGSWAFSNCQGLTNASIGNGVTNIEDLAFNDCVNLKSVTLGNDLKRIGNGAFWNCKNLESVTIPGSVEVLGSEAFWNCTGLKRVTVKEGARGIWKWAFSDCSSLEEVNLPDSLEHIWEWAFSDCSSIRELTIPDRVQRIWECAFLRCSGLKSVIMGRNVAKLDANAFGGCYGLTDVYFKGPPPTVEGEPFPDWPGNARGYYTAEHAAKWLPQIGPDGRWHRLLMAEVPAPELRVESANPSEGSLTLAWTDASPEEGVTYSIYRGEGTARLDEYRVASNITATTWTDTNYWKVEPVTKPLNYWVEAEGPHFDKRASAPVKTRHRHGLCVGYDAYGSEIKAEPLKQCLAEANLCKTLAEKAGFTTKLLPNEEACVNDIHDALTELAGKAKPGDTVLFFIATHGGWDTNFQNNAWLTAYNGRYGTTNLAADVAAFDPGVGFIGVIPTCRSSAMADPSELSAGSVEWIPDHTTPSSGAANWLLEHGLAECTPNVAWVTACRASETAAVNTRWTYTVFGEWFLNQGWQNGWADQQLTGVGYTGGNRDGTNTVLELALYAQAFALGRNEKHPANVYIQNEGLLGKTIVETGISSKTASVPAAPTGVQASQGTRNLWVELKWNASSGATAYRVYRGDECIYYQCTGTNCADTECPTGTTFAYRVCGLNPAGLGPASDPAPGWRKGEESDEVSWKFDISGGKAVIEGIGSATGALVIPSDLDGIPVTEIEDDAFAGHADLTCLKMPDTVTNIGINAFAGCIGLKLLYVPEAFRGTKMLAWSGIPQGCVVVYGGKYELKTMEFADRVENYPNGWREGDNGGEGFGPWNIEYREGYGGGWAGGGIWNPCENSYNTFVGAWEGKTAAFSLVAKGPGWSLRATRAFNRPLQAGESFSLEWGINWDSDADGAEKGFALSANGQDIVVVNHGNYPGNISVNGSTNYDILNVYGWHPMTWTFTVEDATTLRFTATGRDKPGNVCTGWLTVATSAIDGFRLQSANQNANDSQETATKRQAYYDNFRLCQMVEVEWPVNEKTEEGVPYAWLAENATGILTVNGWDYEAAAKTNAANGRPVWECYLAGLSPTEESSTFRVKSISTVDEEVRLEWEPDLNEGGTKNERTYTVYGKKDLADRAEDWADVTEKPDPKADGYRFFRMGVSLPEE